MSKIFAGVGAVGLVIGLLLAFGALSALALVSTPCGNLNANFTYTQSGATITVTDDSTVVTNTSGNSLVAMGGALDWGDSTDQNFNVGQSSTHTYGTAGNYTITDAQGAKCDQSRGWVYYESLYSQTIVVSSGGGNITGTVHVTFSASTTNMQVTVTDSSTVTGKAQLQYLRMDWGDGSANVQESAVGFMTYHVYSIPGSYVVGDYAFYTLNNQLLTTSSEKTVAVKNGTITSSGGYTPLFTSSSVNLAVTITDNTTATSSPAPNVTGISVTWGDDQKSTEKKLGFNATHTYAAPGTYTVTETVSWGGVNAGSQVYSLAVEVSGYSKVQCQPGYSAIGNTTGGYTCQANSTSSPLFQWSAASGFLIIGFGSMMVTAVVPLSSKNVPVIAFVAAIGMGVGALVGFILGHGATV